MTLQDANVRVVLDVSRFENDLTERVRVASERAGKQFERSMRTSINNASSEAGTSFGRELRTSSATAGRDSGRAFRERFGDETRSSALRDIFRASLERFSGDSDAAGRRAGRRFTNAFQGALGVVAGAGALTGLVGGIASSLTALTGLGAALAPTVGIINALPAALATVGAGAIALRVAFAGLGDAFSAAWENDPKKFAESLQQLSPAARAIAVEFRGLVPVLRQIQQSTAQAFFQPLIGQLGVLARNLRGPIQDGLRDIATQAGGAARGIAEVIGSARGAETLRNVFRSTAGFFAQLGPSARGLTSSILGFINATLPAMDRLGRAVVTVTDRFSAYLQRQADSGRALTSVNKALDTFTALGRVLNQVRGIISTVFTAARASTGDFLGSISTALTRTQQFLNSGRGQNALQNTFRGLAEVGRAIAPVFRELIVSLGSIARVAGSVATALSTGIAATIKAIGVAVTNAGPGLTRFGQSLSIALTDAVPSVQSLGTSIGNLLSAIGPLASVAGLGVRALAELAKVFTSLPAPIQATVVALLALQRLGAVNAIGNLTRQSAENESALRRMANAYQTAAAPVREFQRQQAFLPTTLTTVSSNVTGLSAALQRLGTTSASVGSLGTALATLGNNAATGLQRLGTVATGVGSALRTGLSSAVTGLVGALGGPWGLAITGATVALSLWASSNERAKQRVLEHQQAVTTIQGTLDRVSGAITQVTREQAAQDKVIAAAAAQFGKLGVASQTVVDGALGITSASEQVTAAVRRQAQAIVDNNRNLLESKGASDQWRAAIEASGLSTEQLVNALGQGGPAFDQLNQKALAMAASDQAATQNKGQLILGLIQESKAVRDAFGGYQQYQAKVSEAAEAQRRAAEAAGLSVPQLQNLRTATDTLNNSLSTADQKANALYTAMTILNGGTISLEQAISTARGLVDSMASSFANAETQTRKQGQALVDQNGAINTNVEAGRTLLTQTDQFSRSLSTVIQQTYEKARAQGVNETEAAKLATAAGDRLVESYAAQAKAAGVSQEEIKALIANYGLVPSQITTLIQTPGAAQALLQLSNLKGEITSTPDKKSITVDSNAIQNREEMQKLGFTIKDLPNKKVEITANSKPAESALSSFLSSPARKIVDIIGRLVGGNAMGNIYAYKQGGFYDGPKLPGRRMPANRAEIVPPMDLRYIGDRRIGKEAFIPLVPSARNRALARTAAEEVGLAVVDPRAVITPSRSITVAPGAIVVQPPYADPGLVARAVLNEAILQAVG